MRNQSEITQYLKAWHQGDEDAFEELISLVELEITRLAKAYLRRENSDCSLQTTELVNESYIRLMRHNTTYWKDRKHFYAIAAKVMRNFLTDHARKRKNLKRGRHFKTVSIEDLRFETPEHKVDLVKLDDALQILEEFDERQCRIVELKFFAGMTAKEVSELLGVSEITVKRDWLKAKAFLHTELSR